MVEGQKCYFLAINLHTNFIRQGTEELEFYNPYQKCFYILKLISYELACQTAGRQTGMNITLPNWKALRWLHHLRLSVLPAHSSLTPMHQVFV